MLLPPLSLLLLLLCQPVGCLATELDSRMAQRVWVLNPAAVFR
jgi:hypothetical protein